MQLKPNLNHRVRPCVGQKQEITPAPSRRLRSVLCAGAIILGSAAANLPAATFTLEEATIDQIHKAMADGALSSVDLLTMYLNRISIYDKSGIKIDSVETLDPNILAAAATLDRDRAEGKVLGRFAGIPALVKGQFNVKGLATVWDYASFKPTKDAFVVQQLRDQGALIMGKAWVTSDVNGDHYYKPDGETYDNVLSGKTRNPYALGRTVAGSSGGSAAAVSANFTVLAFAEETGESIRTPASFSGVVGVRPTRGLTSVKGLAVIDPYRDVAGPFARSVKDAAAMFDTMTAADPEDRWYSQRPANSPRVYEVFQQTVAGFPAQKPLTGIRMAVPKEYLRKGTESSATLGANVTMEDVGYQNFLDRIADLKALGADVVEIPYFPYSNVLQNFDNSLNPAIDGKGLFDAINAPENAYPNPYDYAFNGSEKFKAWGWNGYIEATDDLRYTNGVDFFRSVDTDATDDSDFETSSKNGVYETTLNSPFVTQAVTYANRAHQVCMVDYMAANGIDAFVVPRGPAYRNDYATEDALYEIPSDIQLSPALTTESYGLQIPAILVPSGQTTAENYPVAGLPMSVSFVGERYSEGRLLAYAYAFEQGIKLRKPPTLTPALPGETIEYSTALPPPSRPELNAPALRVAAGAKVAGKGKKATLVLTGGAVDASGLGSLTVYVNGKKIAAKKAKNWKASVKLAALRSFVKGSAKTVQVTVVAKDVYGNTSVTTKTVKLPKTA